jgi:hypothetical protein
MTYSEFLADRIRKQLATYPLQIEEKKMMGGLTFMVNGKMCVGILKEDLMARIAPEKYEEALTMRGCREMDFTGKPMMGFVFIDPEGTGSDSNLEYWINLALEYNKYAKPARKRKKK